ncbi:reverse transcriptase domain-containing protein [Tanacetum coccineum]
MREVHYHDWLSNPVMVKKHDGSWRMCVDFTDLNKACPQDCYPLPEIDLKVKSLCGYPFKCFLDAYKGYHQIQMAESDEEKTAFHTSQGVYCYTKMPFGLKNAGATYQRLVDKAFNNQVGQNVEVYVDDLVIKSYTEAEMLRDVDETFRTDETVPRQNRGRAATSVSTDNQRGLEPQWECRPDAERGTIQTPVYFISRALQGPELNYAPIEKLVLALVFAAKRLRRYFQAHPIMVITDQPIKQIISRPDTAERLQKWSVMLGEHNITYRPRTSVKGQILTDFLVEKPDEAPPDTSVVETPQEPWTLFTDGLSCVDGSDAGLILTSPEGTKFTYVLRFQFTDSNNEAEYEALIASLRIAAQMGVHNLHVSVDSKLGANQVLGTYIAKEENMVMYLEKAKNPISGFANFSISQVPRSKNKKADALSKIASTSFAHLSKQVLVEVLKEKSIQEKEVVTVVEEEGPTWMTPIVEYLRDGTLPDDKEEASKLCIKARQYELVEGVLYRRSFLTPWLRCVRPLQADYVIKEIHEGSCNMHARLRSMVAKAMRLGYYWPTMHRDAREMIRACNNCQVHCPVPRNPQHPLTPITAPWPFYKWGIDIVGPFPEGPGKVKFLIVAIDYFTKWIEAKAMATITGNQVKKFVWDNIVCHFGLPKEIVSDNGKQFSDNPFKDCDGARGEITPGGQRRCGDDEGDHWAWGHAAGTGSLNLTVAWPGRSRGWPWAHHAYEVGRGGAAVLISGWESTCMGELMIERALRMFGLSVTLEGTTVSWNTIVNAHLLGGVLRGGGAASIRADRGRQVKLQGPREHLSRGRWSGHTELLVFTHTYEACHAPGVPWIRRGRGRHKLCVLSSARGSVRSAGVRFVYFVDAALYPMHERNWSGSVKSCELHTSAWYWWQSRTLVSDLESILETGGADSCA